MALQYLQMSTVHIINFRNMFIHESVNHSEKEYANGIVHVNNYVNAEVTNQIWIRKFMGVNKHNLETYSKTFQQFIHNNKRTKTREERFVEILYN